MNRNEIIKKAIEAMDSAYAPYSKFKVGAALLTKSGKIFTGCNVENSSYGASICAERVAIFKAISEGEREFELLIVATKTEEPSPPCGICRQVISEFSNDLPIFLVNEKGTIIETNIRELLPFPFLKEKLEEG
ncbi:cytidine deaminase [Caldisericum exile]|uniref:Cytidine deaminase n=1 Tax=Caldisericum exile (strain DSM 21853 / NBRC 104410 / AZM16c01) TaxID=511051 RepID=A0A7U6JEP6_CALEA|nr:cytidine deaminase [Caldisericum exile]BAL80946.1 cytidine deaminase [Caldisericum exile AZM16c01]